MSRAFLVLAKTALLLCGGLLSTAILSAQPVFSLRFQINQPATLIAADKLRQLYIVTPDNEVIKYSPEGRELYRFNNNTLGTLSLIDATDPFNLLLYYPDFQVAILLDRTLNQLGQFNLWEYGLFQPRAIGMANDNLLWVYDEVNFTLKKLDRQGQVTAQSDNLNLLLPRPPKPVALLARNNRVYMNDPTMGILVFDNFGQYLRSIPVTGATFFQVLEDDTVWRRSNGVWLQYDPNTQQSRPALLPPDTEGMEQIIIERGRQYVLLPDGVAVYEF